MFLDTSGLFCFHHADELRSDEAQILFEASGGKLTHSYWTTRNSARQIEEAFVLGDEVLIGLTVLNKLDLLADCANRRLVPNPAHPDQPVSKVK